MSRTTDHSPRREFDVVIIGAGPAGATAAVLLGRCRRRAAVVDDGRPRNRAARSLHGFLGHDGIPPQKLRSLGRREAESYGVEFFDDLATSARRTGATDEGPGRFEITLQSGGTLVARKVLLACGVRDELPRIPNFDRFYGRSIHHCPYCDGYEHRDRRLVALGGGPSVAELALELKTWSDRVALCTGGDSPSTQVRRRMARFQIAVRTESVVSLEGDGDTLQAIRFAGGPELRCDAIFVSPSRGRRAEFAEALGCRIDDHNLLKTVGRKGSGTRGVFLAGDVESEVQFAVVAAAAGAQAATAIHRELREEDLRASPRRGPRQAAAK